MPTRVVLGGRSVRLAAPAGADLVGLAAVLGGPGLSGSLRLRFGAADTAARGALFARALELAGECAAGRYRPTPTDPESGQLLELGRIARGVVAAAIAAGSGLSGRRLVRILDAATPLEMAQALEAVRGLVHGWADDVGRQLRAAGALAEVLGAMAGG